MEKWEVRIFLLTAEQTAKGAGKIGLPDLSQFDFIRGYVGSIYDFLRLVGHRAEVDLNPNKDLGLVCLIRAFLVAHHIFTDFDDIRCTAIREADIIIPPGFYYLPGEDTR